MNTEQVKINGLETVDKITKMIGIKAFWIKCHRSQCGDSGTYGVCCMY